MPDAGFLPPAEVVANLAIRPIHQAHDPPDQEIRRLEKDFLKEGGLRERMARARWQSRRQDPPEE